MLDLLGQHDAVDGVDGALGYLHRPSKNRSLTRVQPGLLGDASSLKEKGPLGGAVVAGLYPFGSLGLG